MEIRVRKKCVFVFKGGTLNFLGVVSANPSGFDEIWQKGVSGRVMDENRRFIPLGEVFQKKNPNTKLIFLKLFFRFL